MAAPERFAELSDFSLAPRAPSIHGPSRQFAVLLNLIAIGVPAQLVDATQALNLSAGVSNPKVLRGRSLSWRATLFR